MKILISLLLLTIASGMLFINQGFAANEEVTKKSSTVYLDVNDVSYLIPIVDRSLYPQIELEAHLKGEFNS